VPNTTLNEIKSQGLVEFFLKPLTQVYINNNYNYNYNNNNNNNNNINGVCRICNQEGDSPEAIMVCGEHECIECAHSFCISSAITEVDEEVWWCDAHSVAKKLNHDEFIA
jgi:hypothetical protein